MANASGSSSLTDPPLQSLSEFPVVPLSPFQALMGEIGDRGFQAIAFVAASIAAAVPFCVVILLFRDASPAIAKFGLPFLWQQDWDVNESIFGALPYLYGTLVSSAIALFLALPVGVAVAIVTSEAVLPKWVQAPIAFLVELIAAIPSVIVGLWGVTVLIPVLLPVQAFLYSNFKWLPVFGTEPFGPSLLIAGVVLAIMILPTIAAIGREVFLALSSDLRNGAFALGASQWESIIYIVLPSAAPGIFGGASLALGRALGETMAVAMVIGNVSAIDISLLSPGTTIPSLLANQFSEATETLHIGALMYLALVLFLVTFAVNSLAVFMVRFMNRNA
ncbi:phosphate ABC transporter permease subunit PstC [Altericista sp. CCNU0014]|uniref:phosphate ABC transporter permease subunit PstC n=1 Tax=Altericista sp. CCNU0014 TaxID=3082949 RepID=UPI00384A9D22